MTDKKIDVSTLTPAPQIAGEDDHDTALLRAMLDEAVGFMRSFEWCPSITQVYLGFGIGGVVAVFLFTLEEMIDGEDDLLWVVVGDVPSAYLVTDQARTPSEALAAYCRLMQDWADAVLKGRPLDDVFPVAATPTAEHARMLLSRLAFIRDKVIPLCSRP